MGNHTGFKSQLGLGDSSLYKRAKGSVTGAAEYKGRKYEYEEHEVETSSSVDRRFIKFGYGFLKFVVGVDTKVLPGFHALGLASGVSVGMLDEEAGIASALKGSMEVFTNDSELSVSFNATEQQGDIPVVCEIEKCIALY